MRFMEECGSLYGDVRHPRRARSHVQRRKLLGVRACCEDEEKDD